MTAGACPQLWGEAHTYKGIAYEALPSLGPLDGSFSWLPGDAAQGGMGSADGERLPEKLAARMKEAQALGLRWPASFTHFFHDATLYARVPSCTACYYELGQLAPLPGHAGPERLLRFLNDQQLCLVWALLLSPNAKAVVVVAVPEMADDDESEPTFIDPHTCAESFEEFMKRFCVENQIWFAAVDREEPLTADLLAYATAAQNAAARGLVDASRP